MRTSLCIPGITPIQNNVLHECKVAEFIGNRFTHSLTRQSLILSFISISTDTDAPSPPVNCSYCSATVCCGKFSFASAMSF